MLVPMQRLTLYALKSDRDALLLALQKDGSVMLDPDGEKSGGTGAEAVSSQLEKASLVLRFMEKNGGKKPLITPRQEVSYGDFLKTSEEGRSVTEKVDTLSNRIAAMDSEAAALRTQAESLEPWKDLEIPLEQLGLTETTRIYAGFLPDKEVPVVQDAIKDLLAEMKLYGIGPDGQAVVVVAHVDADSDVKRILKENDFSEAVLPKRSGKAAEIMKELNAEADERLAKAEAWRKEAVSAASGKQQVELYYDQLAAEGDRLAHNGTETDSAFMMTGWVRKDRKKRLEEVVSGVTDAYQLEFRDPNPDEVPPTVLQNNKLVRPYESVVQLYSLPAAGTIDPDWMVAPFHFIFFGMMMSDAGYGIVMTIAFYIAMKKFKPKGFSGNLTMVAFLGSISTILWGALFGGWFGAEWHPLLFVPMNEPTKMLALCFLLGALHLVAGMLTKAYMMIRDGDVAGAFFDEFSWLIMFAGFLLMALLPGPVGKYMAIFGAAVIVLFGGRDRKGIFGRLIGGLLSLYNISGYLSDLLSYSRIFALGLSTGVVGMVINTLARMLSSAGSLGTVGAVIILIGGHFFNILINILSAFVHSSRLQYIEFFGKFFEPGGRAFQPLAFRTKYTDIVK
jgi:V/A-type H+-transporting ATPase subunit I